MDKKMSSPFSSPAFKKYTFVELANLHFMDVKLERVYCKFHFSKDDVNIFMIGEYHSPRNHKGVGILDAFNSFDNAVKRNAIETDILIEISQESVANKYINDIDPKVDQISNVRSFFYGCIVNHNCGSVKVHWIDGDYSVPETETGRTALDELPLWLKQFYSTNYTFEPDDVIDNFRPEIEDRFETLAGVLTLLTENTIVMKEITKASKINPEFNLSFVTEFLTNYYLLKLQITPSKAFAIFLVARAVTDIYTVARIIKSQMKNVIVYTGYAHTYNIERMLRSLQYRMDKQFPANKAEEDLRDILRSNPVPIESADPIAPDQKSAEDKSGGWKPKTTRTIRKKRRSLRPVKPRKSKWHTLW
jgi:hypothetical protein